ncbi:MAG: hypothetical protein R3E53_21570 [Myxococcota bacterium]
MEPVTQRPARRRDRADLSSTGPRRGAGDGLGGGDRHVAGSRRAPSRLCTEATANGSTIAATTHSLWFGFVVGPLLGWLLWRWRDNGRERLLPAWIALSVVALVTHPCSTSPCGRNSCAPFTGRASPGTASRS